VGRTSEILPMFAKDYGRARASAIDWGTAYAQPLPAGGVELVARKDARGQIRMVNGLGARVRTPPPLRAALDAALNPGDALEGVLDVRRGKLTLYDAAAPEAFAARFAVVRAAVAAADAAGLMAELDLAEPVKVRGREELLVCQQHFLLAGYPGTLLRHGRTGHESGLPSSAKLLVPAFERGEFEVVDWKRGSALGRATLVCETPAGHAFTVEVDAVKDPSEWLGKKLAVRYAYYTKDAEPVPHLPVAQP
jgi:hypothetical protein